MMRKLCILFLLAAEACWGAVPADTTEVTELGEPVLNLKYHVRMAVARNRPLVFSLLWNAAADGSARRADISADPVAEADASGLSRCRYAVYTIDSEGAETLETSGEGCFTYATEGTTCFSAVLSADESGANLALGSATPELTVPVDFDYEVPGSLGFARRKKDKVVNNLIISSHRPAVRIAQFADFQALRDYLEASEDTHEGLWEYLDRDVDRTKAMMGAEYRIATVADGAGGYDIIFLEGDAGGNAAFRPMDIKGHLAATQFIEHYDLQWMAASGVVLAKDTSADMEQGQAILRLNFPLLKSTLRFRRWHPNR